MIQAREHRLKLISISIERSSVERVFKDLIICGNRPITEVIKANEPATFSISIILFSQVYIFIKTQSSLFAEKHSQDLGAFRHCYSQSYKMKI